MEDGTREVIGAGESGWVTGGEGTHEAVRIAAVAVLRVAVVALLGPFDQAVAAQRQPSHDLLQHPKVSLHADSQQGYAHVIQIREFSARHLRYQYT